MPSIHPTAIVDAGAQIADDAIIGPYALIGGEVVIGKGCEVMSHAVITGKTTLGQYNRIYHHAALGEGPQDKHYHGEETRLIIGHHNVIREFVTIHAGTVKGGKPTTIGDHNYFMTYAHIGHNCQFHNHIVLVNNVQVAGHVELFDHVMIGACSGIHQFCRVGTQAMVGAYSAVLRDVPPAVLASGQPCRAYGLNRIGLKRRGLSAAQINHHRENFRLLFQRGLEASAAVESLKQADHAEARLWLDFIQSSARGLIRVKSRKNRNHAEESEA